MPLLYSPAPVDFANERPDWPAGAPVDCQMISASKGVGIHVEGVIQSLEMRDLGRFQPNFPKPHNKEFYRPHQGKIAYSARL